MTSHQPAMLAYTSQCSNYRRTGQTDSPTAVVDHHVIHGVEVLALSAPRCCPPTAFFLVLPLIRRWRLHIASLSVIHCIWKTIHLTFDYNFSKCTIHCTAQHLGPIRKWLNRSRCRLANIAGWCDVIPSFHRCCYPVMLLTSPINRQGRWLGWALGTMC